jgi:hypothetical protein
MAHAQFGGPTVNGSIGSGEYGDHADGQNAKASGGQTWYVTWDNANLYVALENANLGEGAILYIDHNPITPANGGSNADGNIVGQLYDGTNFSKLPFRADFVTYFKDGYRDYFTANGSGGWAGVTTGFGSYASSGTGNVRELSIPWSAITGGGRPAAFNFLAYATSGAPTPGFVYGQVPTENAGGNIGTSATYRQYYKISSTADGSSTKPFSLSSSDASVGNASVGGSTGDYTTLKAAFDAVNAGTHKANVNLYVVGSTTESAAATLCASGFNWNGSSCVSGLSNYTSVLIQPSGGSWTISGTLNGALVYLNGAKNVTIDGRQGGTGTTKSLVIDNSNTGKFASALLLENNASFNTVRYVTLQGANADTDRGVVFFGADSTAGTGNDNNTIDNCDIRNSGAGLPVFAILSAGSSSPKENSANTISNNNIANWYRSIGGSYGIYLSSNTTGWTIIGNSFYQTESRAVSNVFGALNVNSGSGHVISGNCIGGQAPGCAGNPLPLTGNVLFQGMRLAVGNAPATSVQGNTIRNISVESSSGSDLHAAIGLNGGSFNIGDGAPNTIGSQTTTGSLSFTMSSPSGTFSGIGVFSGTYGAVVIQNNTIGGINVSGSNTDVRGIHVENLISPTSCVIVGNTIGSASTSSSVRNETSSGLTYGIYRGIGAFPTTIDGNTVANLTGAFTLGGIYSASTYGAGVTPIAGNTVTDLTGTGINTYQVAGIRTDAGAGIFEITGNVVRSLKSASDNTGDAGVVVGILQLAITNNGQIVAQNTVHSLENTAASGAVKIHGIYYSGPGGEGNRVERNFIHSLKLASSNSAAIISGIRINSGKVAVQNNMVRLGIDAAGNAITTGYAISGIYFAGAANSTFHHNTLWVGGAGVASSSSNSAALNLQTTNARVVKNNLLVNVRSNSAGTAFHAAAWFSSIDGLTSDYNLFHASGTDGVLVRGVNTSYSYTTIGNWRTASSQDANSLAPLAAADINLVNSSGPSSAVSLHVQSPTAIERKGTDAGVTYDFDGESRSSLTPTDIGADAGAFVPLDATPPTISFVGAQTPTLLDPTLAGVTITDDLAGVDTNLDTRPRVYYKRSTDANVLNDNMCSTAGWKYVAASGAGGSPFSFTLDYGLLSGCSGATTGTVIHYFVVAQDLATPPNVGVSPVSFASPPASVALTSAAFPVSGTPKSTPAPYVWQGDAVAPADPTDWHTAENWDSNAVPTSQNTALVPLRANPPIVKQAGLTAEAGWLIVEGSGVVTVNPGLTLNVSQQLVLYGMLTGGGTVTIKDMEWHSGSLNNVQATLNGVLTTKGSGKKFVVYGATLTVAAGASVVQEATGGYISCYGLPASPASIENRSTWDLQGDVGLDHYYMNLGETRGTFHNAPGAVFKKTAGAGRSEVQITFDNDGVVEVHTGELELEGRDSETVSSDGQFLIKTAGTLVLSSGGRPFGYYVGPAGVIKDFSEADHGNVRFDVGENVVDGQYNITGSTTALSAPTSVHTLNNIVSLGFVNLPDDNNASLTLNGVGKTFNHLFDIENHTSGVLTVNFATFNVGAPPDSVTGAPAIPKNYTQSCTGSCTWAGSGIAQVWGTTSWLDGYIRGANRATDKFITSGPAILDHNTLKVLDNRTLETNAGLTFKNGEIRVYSATIHNSATGRWDFQCDCDIIEPTTNDSVFDNDGVLGKSVGSMAGQSEFETILNNRRLVDLRQGVFNFRDNLGGTSPGDFAVNEGTLLRLHGNHLISGRVCGNDDGAVNCALDALTGNVEVWDSGYTHFSGLYHITAGTTVMGCCFNETTWDRVPQSLGPLVVRDQADAYFTVGPVTTPYDVTLTGGGILGLNFPDQATTFTVNGVYRQLGTDVGSTERTGIGTLVLASPGPHQWTGGYWNEYGKTVLNAGAALSIATDVEAVWLYAHTFENRGAVTYSGAYNLLLTSFNGDPGAVPPIAPGPMTIDNYGTWDIQTDADMHSGLSVGQNTLNNWGEFQKTAGSDETVLLADVNNKSGGIFAVEAGSMRLRQGALVNDRGGSVIIGLDRWLYVDETVTNNGKIQDTQSSTADEFARITNNQNAVKYRGVIVHDVGMGQTTVTVWGNQTCTIAGVAPYAESTVWRCYELDPPAGYSGTTDATFYYLASERNNNISPYAWHWNATSSPAKWDIQARNDAGSSALGADYRWVKATGLNAFSPYALADAGALAVNLASFEAEAQADHILVTWETTSELNNRGFNLYRGTSDAGPDIQLNETLIPSQSQGNPSGFIYTWEDRRDLTPGTTYFYWLDDVDITGVVTRHGPVSATYQGPTAVTLSELQASSVSIPAVTPGWVGLAGALGMAIIAGLAQRRRT